VDEKKRNPLDFALWKSAKPGEPSWSSPWGEGRPGWHIECSAMIENIFGEQIDIHGGGSDLIFPHHENEIAQSEGCSHKSFVKYWIHWQMLNFSGQKMSKSLGNIISLRQFTEKYHPEIYKFIILSVHYRTVADFSEETINRSISSLAKIYSSLALAKSYSPDYSIQESASLKEASDLAKAWQKIIFVLSDDFNTAEIMAVIYEVMKNFNQTIKRGLKPAPALVEKCQQFQIFFHKVGKLIALYNEDPIIFLNFLDQKLIELNQIDIKLVKEIVAERTLVRQMKDYQKSDELRDKLNSMGISISDTPEGTYWEVTK
jgi:cysteinyl-tRNA synthetase